MASKTVELIEQCHKSAYHAVSLQQPLNSVNQLKPSIDLQWQHGNKGALSSATHILLLTINRPSYTH